MSVQCSHILYERGGGGGDENLFCKYECYVNVKYKEKCVVSRFQLAG